MRLISPLEIVQGTTTPLQNNRPISSFSQDVVVTESVSPSLDSTNRDVTPCSLVSDHLLSRSGSFLPQRTLSLSNLTDDFLFHFELNLKCSPPYIVTDPDLESVQLALDCLMKQILDFAIDQLSDSLRNSFKGVAEDVKNDAEICLLVANIHDITEGRFRPVLNEYLQAFQSTNEFLWREDLYENFARFAAGEDVACSASTGSIISLEKLVDHEHQMAALPAIIHTGTVSLNTVQIQAALGGLIASWKSLHASLLADRAQTAKEAALAYTARLRFKLCERVTTLEQLNETVNLLEELRNMQNSVDEVYRPLEEAYAKLSAYDQRLSRQSIEDVQGLRDEWQKLVEEAEDVYAQLTRERKSGFEQELDKQMNIFVVEVIQFRNEFDMRGPLVSGVSPADAVLRLAEFQAQYDVYRDRRATIDSVSNLYSIPRKPFPELDRTGDELELLTALYRLYQKFISFDTTFRETLWRDVDLEVAFRTVEAYWEESVALPRKLKDWEAFTRMNERIDQYREMLPIMKQLASREIRTRHWLKIMEVTRCSFHLEANIFKLADLMGCPLAEHRVAISHIHNSARHEVELETRLRATEEEWMEKLLPLEDCKSTGGVSLLSVQPARRLVELAEDAGTILALMLTSRHIGPLRDEVATWAIKLKGVRDTLDAWLDVQELWICLKAVFSSPSTAEELPTAAEMFAIADGNWVNVVTKASEMRFVLACCQQEEMQPTGMLALIHADLEACYKELNLYLNAMRRVFPRLYYVSDKVLLSLHGSATYIDSVKPYLR